LIDVPGFAIGSEAEKSGLGRRSGRLLFELGQASVPRVSIVLRKGYGGGYYAMGGGRGFEADGAFAWPTAEICAMSVEGSVDVAYRRDYEAAPDPAARRQEIIDIFKSQLGARRAAEAFGIDEVIDPRLTRQILCDTFDRCPARRPDKNPPRVRPISPI
ncbi:MAG: carboxyl transferase domain-containing protein, partial [Alphaproteobacteria bacterium]|nr:carboxyl transferase domain-containing protein [Alphaproteobacteria bacterium]